MTQTYRLVDGPRAGEVVSELPSDYAEGSTGSAPVGPGGDIPRSAHYLGSPKHRYQEQVAQEEAFDHGEGYWRD